MERVTRVSVEERVAQLRRDNLGPVRWTAEFALREGEGHVYDEVRWNGPVATANLVTLMRLYDRAVAVTDSTAPSTAQLIEGRSPPPHPEQTLLEWLFFVDDWSYGQELRMAVQDGPWEWVDAEVRRILEVYGLESEWRARASLRMEIGSN